MDSIKNQVQFLGRQKYGAYWKRWCPVPAAALNDERSQPTPFSASPDSDAGSGAYYSLFFTSLRIIFCRLSVCL